MFTETPVATTVLVPRLRNIWSSEVDMNGVIPCMRGITISAGSGPSSATRAAPGVPISVGRTPCSRRSLPMSAMILAFSVAPAPSARCSAVQCTTRTPTVRAAWQTFAAASTVLASATRCTNSGSNASGPTTPCWSSIVTTAVVEGSTSERSRSSFGSSDPLTQPRICAD